MKSPRVLLFAVICGGTVCGQVHPAPSRETSNEKLSGVVVRYDAHLQSRSAQADLIVRVGRKGEPQYMRLRYAPNGFGFDAPKARRDQLVPKEMFSEGGTVWLFAIRPPSGSEETAVCRANEKAFREDSTGQLIEISRYSTVPGQEDAVVPTLRSIPCVILTSWSRAKHE